MRDSTMSWWWLLGVYLETFPYLSPSLLRVRPEYNELVMIVYISGCCFPRLHSVQYEHPPTRPSSPAAATSCEWVLHAALPHHHSHSTYTPLPIYCHAWVWVCVTCLFVCLFVCLHAWLFCTLHMAHCTWKSWLVFCLLQSICLKLLFVLRCLC